MALPVTAEVGRFEEAIGFFRERFPMTDGQLEKYRSYAGERAWWVAGVAQMDVLLSVYGELHHAIETGTPLDEFKKRVHRTLEREWGGSVKDPGFRIETIFRTNLQKSYNAGRWSQVQDRDLKKVRPFLQYDAILDHRTTPICTAREGMTLPVDDPAWATSTPPLHHRCRSTIRSLLREDAEEATLRELPFDAPAPRDSFGKPPELEPPWRPDLRKYPAELQEAWREKESKFLATKAKEGSRRKHPDVPKAVERGGYVDHYRTILFDGLRGVPSEPTRDMAPFREAYTGKTDEEAQAIALGKMLPPNSDEPLQPIEVWIDADGKVYLTDGNHRVCAARETGVWLILAHVVQMGPRGARKWEATVEIPLSTEPETEKQAANS